MGFSIVILGPGGVGGYVAAALVRQGLDVTCVAREETAAILQRDGLHIESRLLGDVVVRPAVVTRWEGKSEPQVIIVATKATHLDEVLERLPPGPLRHAVVVPLLNGLEHMDVLRRRLGPRVVAGSIRIESRLERPGHVIQTSPFALIRVASDGGVAAEELARLAAALSGAGLTVETAAGEQEVLWDKLARLAALACTTTLSRRSVGFIRADPVWRASLEGALREGAAVAAACGVQLDVAGQMRIVDAMPEPLTTSMYRDVAAGRPSELDAIAGAVVRAGARQGVACPVLEDLIRRLKES